MWLTKRLLIWALFISISAPTIGVVPGILIHWCDQGLLGLIFFVFGVMIVFYYSTLWIIGIFMGLSGLYLMFTSEEKTEKRHSKKNSRRENKKYPYRKTRKEVNKK